MGGFLNKDQSLDDAAGQILNNLTGLQNIYLEQLYAFGDLNREPFDRTISVAYYALIDIHEHDKELVEQHSASWFSIHEIPDLRYKASHQPVGFELLPEKFTLPELQNLYESIYDTRLDKRNFRRRILSMDVLIKTDEKQKKYSKKGAFFYEFDEKKYSEKVTAGDHLVFKPLTS
jgi:hypothetical protein